MILGFMFRLMIHFGLISVYGVRYKSKFFCVCVCTRTHACTCGFPIVPALFVEDYLFFTEFPLHLYGRSALWVYF